MRKINLLGDIIFFYNFLVLSLLIHLGQVRKIQCALLASFEVNQGGKIKLFQELKFLGMGNKIVQNIGPKKEKTLPASPLLQRRRVPSEPLR